MINYRFIEKFCFTKKSDYGFRFILYSGFNCIKFAKNALAGKFRYVFINMEQFHGFNCSLTKLSVSFQQLIF